MIGNDLVFLPGWSKAKGTRLIRLRNKLFTSAEQKLLLDFPDFGDPLFWSAKESVYKIGFRSDPNYSFSPKSIEVFKAWKHGENVFCQIEYRGQQFIARTDFRDNYLHSIAIQGRDSDGFQMLSTSVQNFQLGSPKELIVSGRRDPIKIHKDSSGVPHFDGNSEYSEYALSISHDGGLIAFAWMNKAS